MTEWPRFLSSFRRDTSAELQELVLRLDSLHAQLQQDGTVADPAAEILDELVAAIEDVRATERRLLLRAGHYERELDAERRRYVGLFDGAPDGYVVTTASGIIVEANAAVAEMFGRRQEHLVRKPLAVLVVLDDRRALRKATLHAAETGFADVEFDVDSPRGMLNVEARATAELSETHNPQVRWILRDVTARKNAQRALATLNAELVGKRLELLTQAVPGVGQVAVLWLPGGALGERTEKQMLTEGEAAARGLGVRLQIVEARGPADLL